MFGASRKSRILGWLVLGTLLASILQIGQVRELGGSPTSLISAGIDHPLAPVIQRELPGVVFAEGIGHDGQLFYAMGLDLLGAEVPEAMRPTEEPAYRYRRILFPALASAGGALDGSALLWGMIVISALAVGVAAAAAADIAAHFEMSHWLAAAVVLNPGVWMSARLLTADNLALALGLLAVAAFLRGRIGWAGVCLALAALGKEPALAFAVGVAGYSWFSQSRRAEALRMTIIAVVPLALWMIYLTSTFDDPLSASGNLVLPGVGVVEGAMRWPDLPLDESIWSVLTLVTSIVAVLGLWRGHPLWRWLSWAWVAVGLVASELVWTLGNNAIRTLAPIITLTVLGVAHRLTAGTGRPTPPAL